MEITTLTQAQKIIVEDKHRFRVVRAGRRVGKTTVATLEMLGMASQQSKRNIIYLATTYQQARDICWATLKSLAENAITKLNESRLEVEIKSKDGGSSTITLRGWENIDTLRGQKVDFIILDEVASMKNFWENWQEIIRPALTDTKGQALFISTPKGYNHFYDLCNLELKDLDFKSFHFSSYDNPNLPVEEIEKAKKELTDDRFAQEYLAEFKKTEGLVYKEFQRDIHIYEKRVSDDITDVIAGVDFGFTNPCAVITILKDYSGHYWIEEEWYKIMQTEAQIVEYVNSKRFNKVYPDPENPSAIEQMRRQGVNVREVIKNKDSIIQGIQRIRELLKQGKLHINKNCVNTIMEFETYSYPDKDDMQNAKELPIKDNDHALDAIRYVIYMQPKDGGNIVKTHIPQGISRIHTYIPKNITR
jgi:PBSX family phage terminase large subunit